MWHFDSELGWGGPHNSVLIMNCHNYSPKSYFTPSKGEQGPNIGAYRLQKSGVSFALSPSSEINQLTPPKLPNVLTTQVIEQSQTISDNYLCSNLHLKVQKRIKTLTFGKLLTVKVNKNCNMKYIPRILCCANKQGRF